MNFAKQIELCCGSFYICACFLSQGTFPVLPDCNLELAAVDAVLGACRAVLADFSGTMDSDQNSIRMLAQEFTKHGMSAEMLRRMSILQLRVQERRILNKTVSVLISQKRQLSAIGQRAR